MGEHPLRTFSGLSRSLRPSHGTGTTDHGSTAGPVRHGWIPVAERWVAVDVHEPSAPARGATVVVAAPPGRERVTMTRTVLHTARALAADGWRVVRFDWSGTGQCPSTDAACDAGNWAADLHEVARWAGDGEPVRGVAFSVAGAWMAADADEIWSGRLLLAPASGKQWLRHQSALRRMAGAGLPPRVTEGTELLDLQLSTEGTAAVKAVPAPAEDPGRGIRVLPEESTGPLPLDVHPRAATVPSGLTHTVVTALAADAPARGTAAHHDDAAPRPAETVTVDVHGTAVRLARTANGGAGRPAIRTDPVQRDRQAPGLALVSPGSETMEGAGGLWLRTALLASAAGAVCLLAERTDTGELVDATRVRDSNPYARHTVVECRELVTHLADLTDGPLAAAGICLGAWGLVAAAPELPAEVATSLSKIDAGALRMSSLVDDLLLLARLEAGRQPTREDTVDVSSLLIELVEDAHVVNPDHGITLDVPPEAIEVRGAVDQVRRVVSSVLTNACVHTPPGTRIHVEAQTAHKPVSGQLPQDIVVIHISDEGPGIPPEIRERVFDRFVRGDPSRARRSGAQGGSSGLGLAIAAGLVELMHGSISMSSSDEGTDFELRLPAA